MLGMNRRLNQVEIPGYILRVTDRLTRRVVSGVYLTTYPHVNPQFTLTVILEITIRVTLGFIHQVT